ncbi:MAG: hypothetical protein ACTSSK_04980 [Candidatus Heimdallarchaeota archaeon]
MKISTFKNHNLKATCEESPMDIIKNAFYGIDLVVSFAELIQPGIQPKYLSALKKLLKKDVKKYNYNIEKFDLTEAKEELEILNDYPEIQELVVQLICKDMNPSKDYQQDQGKYELLLLDWLRAYLLWRYYRAKTFIEIFGRKEGIKFWKKIVIDLADFTLETSKERDPIKEVAEGWLKYGKEADDNALMDYTVVNYDDHRVLVKFDQCGVHEAMMYLKDPELTYLSYCYVGDVEDERTTKIRRRRRTHSLHLDGFCDEFFWDNSVYPDAEHPELEFMRKLGKEDPEDLMEEYS